MMLLRSMKLTSLYRLLINFQFSFFNSFWQMCHDPLRHVCLDYEVLHININ